MQRIMIIGQPGAGKSTLARALADITYLPVVHIDHIHWKSGWIERCREEKTMMCQEVHARQNWIFEGGHSATYDERVDRADMIIWIDLPIWLRLFRVVKRSISYSGRTRPDLPSGCPERVDPSFLKWIWDTRHRGRRGAKRIFSDQRPDKAYHHLKSQREVAVFLTGLREATSVGNLGIPHR